MKKFAVAAALLSAIVATPTLAAEGGEAHVEARGGFITGNGLDDVTLGVAAGYDVNVGKTFFLGAEVAADKVLKDNFDVQFSAGGRIGAQTSDNGKVYLTGGYTFSDIDDPYVGAAYQQKIASNIYGKLEYRHQFVSNFGDFDTFGVGVGVAF